MFGGESGKSFLHEAAIEIGVVGDNEHYPVEQIVDSVIVDAFTGDHLVGNASNLRDLRRDRDAGVFEPLPGAEDFVDPPALTVIFEEADPEFDNLVVIRVGAGGFHIHDGGNELWTVIGWVVFGQRPQPTGDAIIAAFDERPGHLFECLFHVADIAKSKAVFNHSGYKVRGRIAEDPDSIHKGKATCRGYERLRSQIFVAYENSHGFLR